MKLVNWNVNDSLGQDFSFPAYDKESRCGLVGKINCSRNGSFFTGYKSADPYHQTFSSAFIFVWSWKLYVDTVINYYFNKFSLHVQVLE